MDSEIRLIRMSLAHLLESFNDPFSALVKEVPCGRRGAASS
jgi:hypothetical protein